MLIPFLEALPGPGLLLNRARQILAANRGFLDWAGRGAFDQLHRLDLAARQADGDVAGRPGVDVDRQRQRPAGAVDVPGDGGAAGVGGQRDLLAGEIRGLDDLLDDGGVNGEALRRGVQVGHLRGAERGVE